MNNKRVWESLILGAFIGLGLIILGYFLADSVTRLKAQDRTVTVKGLAEQEMPADIAIWPIRFTVADNDLSNLFTVIQRNNALVMEFLKNHGFSEQEISISVPAILDRQAQEYVDASKTQYRYSAFSAITVYTDKVAKVRETMEKIVELVEHGIAIAGSNYQSKPQFLFTRLNDLKPAMIEKATQEARQVAEKFAKDSGSQLGKIKRARQGLFEIKDRDSNTPYIKKIRVVSTIEYFLSD
ncbi:MAG: SIMPL domain-containing protein [Deltaproteobacteria bacterium]|nr:SIMPL domain-containing protein [Deltaproteobacteria bacterium]MBW1952716.1 SIMPL domain-containing protein [Deltaproteobacteria bacterium]MBW1986306.1 SIMPL domain-containing protein [Deltaproteobacteria bacterium]MBW2134347.1 SIMPL domain-containing protein [Deltaproteobacteria bacterium]